MQGVQLGRLWDTICAFMSAHMIKKALTKQSSRESVFEPLVERSLWYKIVRRQWLAKLSSAGDWLSVLSDKESAWYE